MPLHPPETTVGTATILTMTHRTNPLTQTRQMFPTTLTSAVAISALLVAAACNSTKSPNPVDIEVGSYVEGPSGNFFTDENFAGLAQEVLVSRQFYGRLVSVAAFDSQGTLTVVHDDLVVNPQQESQWALPYELRTNRVNGAQTLVIFKNIDDRTPGGEFEQFVDLVKLAGDGVRPVADLGFIGPGNYTMVPRNAAFVIQFSDLIDPATINPVSVRILQGDPTISPVEARVFADANYGGVGDFDGVPGDEFYSTRIVVDPSISAFESLASNLPANLLGFDASANPTVSNVEVRLPTTRPAGQQNPVLQNPSEHTLTTNGNGTFDFGTVSRELVRAFRSGGNEQVTGDPFSGFLPDDQSPCIIGTQSVTIETAPTPAFGADPFLFDLPSIRFGSVACAQSPQIGDVIISSSGAAMEVVADRNVDALGVASNVRVRLLQPLPTSFQNDPLQFEVVGAGPAQYTVDYRAAEDSTRPQCFITVSPVASGFPNNPTTGIVPGSSFAVRFSESILPDRMEPYESFRLTRERQDPLEPADYVVGGVSNDLAFQEFTFTPSLPLTHTTGTSETYFMTFPDGDRKPRDLAGNDIDAVLPPIELRVEATAPESMTGGRVVLFNSADEEFPFANETDEFFKNDTQLEWFGQINYDGDLGRVRGRPVVRQQIFVSATNRLPNAMPLGPGTNLPLNGRGARTQFVWRYADLGLPLYDEENVLNAPDIELLNIDIEQAYLSPLNNNPVFESYPEFAMNMAHAAFLPDEVINPQTGALVDPDSGLFGTYDNNLVDPVNDFYQEVSPREQGFTINPGDQTLAADDTPLIPLPMNQGVAASQKRFYTFRDTAITAFGGATTNFGVPPARVAQVTGIGGTLPLGFGTPMVDCMQPGNPNPIYPQGFIRTLGLPLLMDFRCYPGSSSASGNLFAHRLAHASDNPFFRAFSAGGLDQGLNTIIVDPDAENVANGGFDPTTSPPGGAVPGLDNVLYFGGLDLVMRVSRAYSVFYAVSDPTSFLPGDPNPATDYPSEFANAVFSEPEVFPLQQPTGTSVVLAYRGATNSLTNQLVVENTDAKQTDPYGDFFVDLPVVGNQLNEPGSESCFDLSYRYELFDNVGNYRPNSGVMLIGGQDWRNDIAEISGASYFQVRMSLINNVETGAVPAVSALGFAWSGN